MAEFSSCQLDESCVFTRPGYFDALHETASNAHRSNFSNCVCTIGVAEDSASFSGLPLVAPELHLGRLLTIEPAKEVNGNELYSAYHLLANQLQFFSDYSFCRFELLLWYAVSVGDAYLLEMTLAKRKEQKLPKCLMAALLHRAIEFYFDSGVRILLLHGASPDIALGDGRLKIPIFQVCYGGIPNIQDQRFNRENLISRKVDCMLKSLIDFGADLLTRDDETGEIPIHFCAHLALRSPEAVVTLIEATPASGLRLSSRLIDRFELFHLDSATPLETTLIDVASLALNSQRCEKIARIVDSAVLPLIRAGAVMSRNPFSYDFPPLSCLFLSLWYTIGSRKWADFLLKLFIEISALSGTRKPMTDFSKWLGHLDNVYGLGFCDADFLEYFNEKIRNIYPRSLMASCRVVVWKSLGIGCLTRRKSLEYLNIPKCVVDYINFSDYDSELNNLAKKSDKPFQINNLLITNYFDKTPMSCTFDA